jgi:hypothetical protein
LIAADTAFYSNQNEAAAEAKEVKSLCIGHSLDHDITTDGSEAAR